MKKYIKIVIIMLCIMFISGCNNKDMNDNDRFKKEYSVIDIDFYNDIKYSNIDEVLDIIDNGSGVIYLGSSDNDLCLVSVPVLLNASDSTDLSNIYYVNTDNIDKEFSIEDKDGNVIISNDKLDIPLVMFIYEGDIKSYHIGTIDNKLELSEDETIELYNLYLEGIHSVLNDQCDSDNSGEEHC